MPIAGRHVRHDWQTFVDWEQVSVRTLCGRTTKQHLAGVPGVTKQPLVVSGGDKNMSGWCINCASRVNVLSRNILRVTDLTDDIRNRYAQAVMATERAAQAFTARKEQSHQRMLDRRHLVV